MTLLMFQANPYFFEPTFNTAKQGIQQYLGAFQGVAYGVLTLTFLVGVYEAFVNGGRVRDLAVTFLKYTVAALMVQYWDQFFTAVTTNGFTQVAHMLDSSFLDIVSNWWSQLSAYWTQNGVDLWSVLTGTLMGVVSIIVTVIGYACFIVATNIFTWAYSFWGCILYVLGPVMIALMPSTSVGQYAKQYLSKFAEWAAWPILFSVFSTLVVAVNANTTSALLQSLNVVQAGAQLTAMIMISLQSILYALCIVIIPFIAHALIKGEFMGLGGVMMALGIQATRAITALAGGAVAGAASAGATSGIGGGGQGFAPSVAEGAGGGSIFSMPPNNTPDVQAGLPPGPPPGSFDYKGATIIPPESPA